MYPTKDIQTHLYGGSDPIFMFHKRLLSMDKLHLAPTGVTGPIKLGMGYSPGESLAVITITNDVGGTPSVQYQALKTSIASPIANVNNFHYIPNCSKDLRQDDYYLRCTKAGLRTQRSLKKVLAFLNGNNDTSWKGAGMIVGEDAIVERLEVETRKGDNGGKLMVNFTQFCETRCTVRAPFLLPLCPGLSKAESVDIQFISLRGSNLKGRDKIEELSSVNILSGICLFSQAHFGYLHGDPESPSNGPERTLTEPADHLIPLPLDRRPTLYEIESLIRLPNAIADIISTLPATLDITITLDVPQAQYYTFLLDLYARGCCSKGHINSWLEVIDRRHDQISEVFEKAVKDALQRRGADRKGVRIELSTGLDEVIPYIRETIDQGSTPSVKDLLQKLLEKDPLFREYYEHLPQSQGPPQSLVNLCFASYSYQVLRPVFRRVHEHKSSGAQKKKTPDRQLLIHIDNPSEWRIYSQAEKILKEYQKKYSSVIDPLLLGMFPRELIFTSGNTGRTSLYLQNIGQYIYDESEKRIISPSDITEKIYGTDVTRRVVDLMRKMGMFNM